MKIITITLDTGDFLEILFHNENDNANAFAQLLMRGFKNNKTNVYAITVSDMKRLEE